MLLTLQLHSTCCATSAKKLKYSSCDTQGDLVNKLLPIAQSDSRKGKECPAQEQEQVCIGSAKPSQDNLADLDIASFIQHVSRISGAQKHSAGIISSWVNILY